MIVLFCGFNGWAEGVRDQELWEFGHAVEIPSDFFDREVDEWWPLLRWMEATLGRMAAEQGLEVPYVLWYVDNDLAEVL